MTQEVRLKGIEILPEISERIKENVCMIIARLDHRFNNVDIQKLITDASSLHAMNIICKGTGFLISTGYVVTAYHVIENAYKIECLTPQGWIDLKLAKYSKQHDIALLKPEIKWSKGIDIKLEVIPHLRKGEIVFTLGYPLTYYDLEPILSVGFLSSIQERNGVKRLIVNAAFNVGNSGGPLLNLQGDLLGIVVAKSVFIEPLMNDILQVLRKPGVDLVYNTVRLPGGISEVITLSKVIQTIVKWVRNNIQTNIGEAVSVEHLVQLLVNKLR